MKAPIHPEPAAASPRLPERTGFDALIEPYAALWPQRTCCPDPKPGVVAFRRLVLAAFPATGCYGISRPCDVPGRSEHKEGRAWDWRVDAEHDRDSVDELLSWLLTTDEHGNRHAVARRIGLMYMIWSGRIWGAYAAQDMWRPYDGPHPHLDHVHFSFSWAGALGRTSWWSRPRAGQPGRQP